MAFEETSGPGVEEGVTNEAALKRKNRGKVLNEIIEEVYEAYGGNASDSEEDARDLRQPGAILRRASSEVAIRGRNLLTSSSGAQSPLTLQAVQFIKEFEQSRVELVPLVVGQLYTLQLLPKKKPGKPSLRFVVLNPIQGELTVFKNAGDYRAAKMKNAAVFELTQVLCAWGPSGRIEMRRHQIAAAIELNFYDESILMFGAHEKD